ncbi:MAG: hypothetical protein GY715_09475 [Planctomycetes bacterium]|nr:hypothetical protein [Planctomycetota bacterium]
MTRTIAWGVFCACSWTWCIGMYLPRIMLDRFGPAGFLVFAIPNIVGCAGFGYVLATRRSSVAMVERHGPAMVVFSLAAVAFHVFFLAYLGSELWAEAPLPGTVLAAGMFVVGLALSVGRDRFWLPFAVAVYALSLAAFVVIARDVPDPFDVVGRDGVGELAWLAPVIVVGFLLCPYLDLTFHRARQEAPSHHAFAVFGVTFAAMIVLTCFVWFAPSPVPSRFAVAHIIAQSAFTMGAHLREARCSPALACGIRRGVYLVLPLVAGLIPFALRALIDRRDGGDEVYLRFLVFYSLAFPAYVLLFIGPWRPLAVSRRTLIVLAIVIVAFAPLYEAGFIHHRAWLLALPAAAIAGWAVVRSRRPRGA